jgi:hypothetical protein
VKQTRKSESETDEKVFKSLSVGSVSEMRGVRRRGQECRGVRQREREWVERTKTRVYHLYILPSKSCPSIKWTAQNVLDPAGKPQLGLLCSQNIVQSHKLIPFQLFQFYHPTLYTKNIHINKRENKILINKKYFVILFQTYLSNHSNILDNT